MLSFELAAEDIHDPRTREHFREVISTLGTGCYRSCIVVLWSVVVADLVYKLQDLRDLYGDPTAKAILERLAALQKANQFDSKWESDLLNEVNQHLSLFGPGEYTQLLNLQKLRHLSAHPVLNSTDVLFVPTKESVRANVRVALEGALLKPPVFSKKIAIEFVMDLSAKKSLLPDMDSLKRYIEARYAKGLTRMVEAELIRTLWKFSFKTVNADTDANREINVRALAILFERRPNEHVEFVRANRDVLSDVTAGAPLDALIHFLGRFPAAHQPLTDAAKVLIVNRCEESLDLFLRAAFLTGDESAHVSAVADRMAAKPIGTKSYDYYTKKANACGCLSTALQAGATQYTNSPSFDDADKNFTKFVEEYLPQYDASVLQYLVNGIESNRQTYDRGRAAAAHAKIFRRCMETIPGFDIAQFPNFAGSFPKQ